MRSADSRGSADRGVPLGRRASFNGSAAFARALPEWSPDDLARRSARNKRMRREEDRWLFDADVLRDRGDELAEAFNCVLGLEYIQDAEAVRTLTGDMN